MIRFGADKIIKMSNVDTVLDLDHILAQGQTQTAELTKRIKESLATSMSDNFRSDGGDFSKSSKQKGSAEATDGDGEEGAKSATGVDHGFVLELGKRQRKVVLYNEGGGEYDDSRGEDEGWKPERKKPKQCAKLQAVELELTKRYMDTCGYVYVYGYICLSVYLSVCACM